MLMVVGGLGGLFPNIERSLWQNEEGPRSVIYWRRWGPILLMEALAIGILGVYETIWEQVMYLIFMLFLVFLSCCDIKYMLLPSKVIFLGSLFGLIFQGGRSLLDQQWFYLIDAVVGAIVGVGLFSLLHWSAGHLLKREALGLGDVRLIGMIGIYVGIDALFLVLIMGGVLALMAGGVLYLVRRKSDIFPFGPFLSIGSLLIVIGNNFMMPFYLNWIGV